MTLYCTYLAYSSLISEPHDYVCNGLGRRLNAASASTLAAGMFLTLLSVVYSALRAGSNTALFSFGEAAHSETGEAMESLIEAGDHNANSAGLDGAPTEAPAEAATDRTGVALRDGVRSRGSLPVSAGADQFVCVGRSEESAIEEFQPVTYNYSFFHLIFALASCYIAMLMTGWGTGAEERDLIDVGWVSVWVKIVTQWLTAATYCWVLVAPALLTDREF